MAYTFVRSLPNGESEWRDADPDAAPATTITLTPAHVMTLGLGDKLREGVANEATPNDVRPVKPNPSERKISDLKVLGGHTDAWRWQAVEDGDELVWAIDNQPALDVWAQGDRLDPAPSFYNAVVPDDVLRAIVPVSPHG